MKKVQHILLLLIVSLQLAAQVPDWYLSASRKEHYPLNVWYTGYVEGEKHKGEKLDDAILRIKDAARAELVSSILTTVEQRLRSSAESQIQQSSEYYDEYINEHFSIETYTKSNIKDVPELNVDVFYNKKNETIAAFAYLNKIDVCNKLVSRQMSLQAKINSTIIIIDYLISEREVIKAGEELKKAQDMFLQTDDNFKWLSIFGCDNEKNMHLLTQHTELKHKLEQLSSYLSNNAMSIYLVCSGSIFDIPCSAMIDQIKSGISELSCSFTDAPSHADWIIEIKTEATSRKKANDLFVNVSITGKAYCVQKRTYYALSRSGEDSAPTNEKRVADIIIQRDLLGSIINDIIEILKSK